MSNTEYAFHTAKMHPVRTGVLAIVGVIAAGAVAGVALGFTQPQNAAANITVIAPLPVTPTPPPVVVAPTPVVVPAPIVVVAPTQGTGGSSGSGSKDQIVVIGNPTSGNIDSLPPCCTQPAPTTPPVIDSLPPCCTEVTPPVVPVIDVLPPCCTIPETPTIPPVVPPTPPPPPVIPPVTPPTTPTSGCISLTASKTTVTPGEQITLTWKAKNVNQITITDIGTITGSEALAGSRVVTASTTKTYVASVPGDTNNPNCKASVTIPGTESPSQCISLTASASEINRGDSVTLTWRARNNSQITITDVGTVTGTEATAGSRVITPTADKTYTASVPGDENNPSCKATVKIKTGGGGSNRCVSLTASDTTITSSQSITLTWSATKGPVTITKNDGSSVGIFTSSTGTVDVVPGGDATYHASIPEDQNNSDCTVSVTKESGGGGGGGGHHGGGHHKPDVYFDSNSRLAPPLSSVYLSEIPYTGLDLGPIGTVIYWTLLVIWSLAAAYLVLFGGVPFLRRKFATFGANVSSALNQPAALLPEHAMAGAMAMPAASIHVHQPVPQPTVHEAVHQAAVQAVIHEEAPRTAPAPRLEMNGDGFKRFANAGSSLTIDDIVKGLSRESGMQFAAEPAHEAPVAHAPVHEEAPAPAPAAPVMQTASAPRAEAQAHAFSPDVIAFITAILEGERDMVFGTIRRINQAGHDAEEFMAHAICALDDAYRARLDGTPVHADVKQATDHLATSFLERLVSALTTAVDGSYTMGVTGIKLALTRALAVAQG